MIGSLYWASFLGYVLGSTLWYVFYAVDAPVVFQNMDLTCLWSFSEWKFRRIDKFLNNDFPVRYWSTATHTNGMSSCTHRRSSWRLPSVWSPSSTRISTYVPILFSFRFITQMLSVLLLLSTAQSIVDSIALTVAIDAVLKIPDGGEFSRPRVIGCTIFAYNLGYILGGVGGGWIALVSTV